MATNNKSNNVPARGDAKVIEKTTGVQQVNEVAVDGTFNSPVNVRQNQMGALPGTVNEVSRRKSLVLAGLGDVHADQAAPPIANGADIEGEGDRVVVIVDYVSGPGGVGFMKGNVRYLSLFFESWGDEKFMPLIRSGASRLFELDAIRLATEDEATMSQIDVTPSSETSDVQKERDARIRAERELNSLRMQLVAAQIAQDTASPLPNKESGLEGHELQGAGAVNTEEGMPDF